VSNVKVCLEGFSKFVKVKRVKIPGFISGKKSQKKCHFFLAGIKELLPLSPRKKGNKSYGGKKRGLKPVLENRRIHIKKPETVSIGKEGADFLWEERKSSLKF